MAARFHRLRVAALHRTTADSVTVTFDAPAAFRAFVPGQYLTLRATIDGRDVRRCYSICSGRDDGTVRVGIKHVAGTVAMANLGPGTARADFFILTTDAPSFDATFAAFGKVVEGMDVAKTILAAPVSATKGEGIMRGQMLDPVVKITKAARLD